MTNRIPSWIRPVIIITIIIIAIFSCGSGGVAWHPDKDGSGLWRNPANGRLLYMERQQDDTQTHYLVSLFSESSKEDRTSFIDFNAPIRDTYQCSDDERLKIVLDGAHLTIKGVYNDGKAFTETFTGVDIAYRDKLMQKLQETYTKLDALKSPTLEEQVLKTNIFSQLDILKSIELKQP